MAQCHAMCSQQPLVIRFWSLIYVSLSSTCSYVAVDFPHLLTSTPGNVYMGRAFIPLTRNYETIRNCTKLPHSGHPIRSLPMQLCEHTHRVDGNRHPRRFLLEAAFFYISYTEQTDRCSCLQENDRRTIHAASASYNKPSSRDLQKTIQMLDRSLNG